MSKRSFLATVALATIFAQAAAMPHRHQEPGEPGPPDRISVPEANGEPVVLTVRLEVLHDLSDDSLFAGINSVAPAVDGTLYVLDIADSVVRLLDKDGVFQFSFGGEGQGPGEFQDPYSVDTTEDSVWVFDRSPSAAHQFTPSGDYVRSVRIPFQLGNANSFFVEGDTIYIGALSLNPTLHGYSLHRFRVSDGDEAAFIGSLAESQTMDPSFYRSYAGGRSAPDHNGDIVYAQHSPYDLRKYRPDGELLWRFQDEAAFQPALTYFEVMPDGRVRFAHHPHSVRVYSLAESLYLHVLNFPKPEVVAGEEYTGSPYVRGWEILEFDQDEVAHRYSFRIGAELFVYNADSEGGIYANWRGGALVRATLELIPFDAR